MLALKSMASGDPLDQQRDKRWPNMTATNNLKVEFKADDKEEAEDYSDLGEFAPPVDASKDDDAEKPDM